MYFTRFNASLVAFSALLLAAAFAGCGGSAFGPSSPGAIRHSRHSQYVVTAQNGVFLGAQVNPSAYPESEQEGETESLEQFINRPLALHHEYRSWSQLDTDLTQDPEIPYDIANGRIPVIAMNCADNIEGRGQDIRDIVNNQVDTTDLQNIRTQLAKLNYPVIIRWFWEFNVNANFPQNDPNGNNCFETPDPHSNPTIPPLATQYIEAYQKVRSVLLGGAPVPQLTFVWNPTATQPGTDDYNEPIPPASPWPYYPGSQNVDWIAFDGYSTVDSMTDLARSFNTIFQSDIATVSDPSYGNKPVMIGETAACNDYPAQQDQNWQTQYIQSIQSEWENGTYPTLHAVMYFDAQGQYQFPNNQGPCYWNLEINPIEGGSNAFKTMANDPNFTGMITPSNP